jgi:hypothetical protein
VNSVGFALILAIVAVGASGLGRPVAVQDVAARAAPAPVDAVGGCTGLPYSAKQTETRIKARADGTTTEQKQVQLIWRDAEDRTRTELVGETASGGEYHFITVDDPVARAHWTWSANPSAKKVVNVRPFTDKEGPATCWPPASQQEGVKHFPGSGTTVEKLPPTTINGVPVLGDRITRVFSSGADGNKHEFTSTDEFWISPDLGVLVRHVLDNPRMGGKIITELSDVQRATPDPALFKAPKGYDMLTVPPPVPTPIDEVMKSIKPVLPQPLSK